MSTPTCEIARWLREARDGSRESLGRLFETYQPYLFEVARKALPPSLTAKADAADLVQETFLQAHTHFEQFQGNTASALTAWLRQTLVRQVANFMRRFCRTAKRRARREVGLPQEGLFYVVVSAVPGGAASPEAILMAEEQSAALYRALDQLPEDYRRALVMRHLDDLSFQEIARNLNRSCNAAEKLCARALGRVRQACN
jgi:RNA polymerase sigma-70 factor (ECF subfamily)